MRKINYRITVNITQKTMKLGFRAKMPDEMQGKRIRVQDCIYPETGRTSFSDGSSNRRRRSW